MRGKETTRKEAGQGPSRRGPGAPARLKCTVVEKARKGALDNATPAVMRPCTLHSPSRLLEHVKPAASIANCSERNKKTLLQCTVTKKKLPPQSTLASVCNSAAPPCNPAGPPLPPPPPPPCLWWPSSRGTSRCNTCANSEGTECRMCWSLRRDRTAAIIGRISTGLGSRWPGRSKVGAMTASRAGRGQ